MVNLTQIILWKRISVKQTNDSDLDTRRHFLKMINSIFKQMSIMFLKKETTQAMIADNIS